MAKKKRARSVFKAPSRKPSKRTVTDRLLIAAGHFVAAHGGKTLVAGGVHITTQPGDEYRFTLCIKMTGRPPESSEHDGA